MPRIAKHFNTKMFKDMKFKSPKDQISEKLRNANHGIVPRSNHISVTHTCTHTEKRTYLVRTVRTRKGFTAMTETNMERAGPRASKA
jgi:hypothetical protein